VLQLYHSVNEGYYEARSLGYLTQPGNVLLEWMRMPGDILFIGGGILPFIWISWVAVRSFWQSRNTSGSAVEELPDEPLYTELPAAAAATEDGDVKP
jgi:nitric oxide reductase subunit B